MKQIILGLSVFIIISCSYKSSVHITGFIFEYNPKAKYDVIYFSNKYEGQVSSGFIEIQKIDTAGWFELDPDSTATANLIRSDSSQFRKKIGDSVIVLSTIRPLSKLYRYTIIDNHGTKYYVRYKGRGVSYLDNLQIGRRD